MSARTSRVFGSDAWGKFATSVLPGAVCPWACLSLASFAMSSFRPRTITGTNAGSADTIQLVRYDMIRLIRYAKPDAFKLLLGRRYNRVKRQDGGHGNQKSGDQIDTPKTADRLATEHGVSPATVKRAGAHNSPLLRDGNPP
jgi:hypothetical protein